MLSYQSWGRYPHVTAQSVHKLAWRPTTLPKGESGSLLPYGLGRSQGDSCLNEGGTLIDVSGLDHFIHFDPSSGRLRAEAGVTLAAINDLIVARGWFLPVTPGTKYVTLGGAIANDVHGKNHLRAGTFGRHVKEFELLRSDDQHYRCSPTENRKLFEATIGGLGLTGLITWVEIQLKRIDGPYIAVEHFPFNTFSEYVHLVEEKKSSFEYLIGQMNTVGRSFGQGVLMGGNHTKESPARVRTRKRPIKVPLSAPNWLLNNTTMRLYYRLFESRQRRHLRKIEHFDPYFYPLDSIHDWNLLYGSRGFLQYQCVVPFVLGKEIIPEMLKRLQTAHETAYLTSLKVFGDLPSPGLLSFPQPGWCIALDMPVRGTPQREFLNSLDDLVRAAGGRVYPAKDARLSPQSFQAMYPEWQQFAQFIDPAFSSSFWRRVTSSGEV